MNSENGKITPEKSIASHSGNAQENA